MTIWSKYNTSPGTIFLKNSKRGSINVCFPSHPNTAVKNSINGKKPITSIKPISAAIPKRSLSTIDFIIFLIVTNIGFTV
jgi:hypothetical protein